MIVVPDVNVLLYALHPAGTQHAAHAAWLRGMVNGPHDLGLVDAVLTGVARLATHPCVFEPPVDRATVRRFLTDLRTAPRARPLHANDAVYATFDALLADDPQATGNLVPDAWLAAVTIAHGGRLATADRGMARWPGLELLKPVA